MSEAKRLANELLTLRPKMSKEDADYVTNVSEMTLGHTNGMAANLAAIKDKYSETEKPFRRLKEVLKDKE